MKNRKVIFIACTAGLCLFTVLASKFRNQLSNTNSRRKDTLEAILQRLRDETSGVREQAIEDLSSFIYCSTPDAVKHGMTGFEVRDALEADEKARNQFLQQSQIVEALLVSMEDVSPLVRRKSAWMLGNVKAPEAQESLLRHLRSDPVGAVRKDCVYHLGFIPDSPAKTAGLIEALKDSEWWVAYWACECLAVVEPLRTVLTNASWRVRLAACEALVNLESVDAEVVHVLEEANQDPQAKAYNEMTVKQCKAYNESFERYHPEIVRSDPYKRTTWAVLERAYRLLDHP